jgi:hypothetical protein
MHITIDLEPLVEQVGQAPTWLLAAAAAHAWYALAGLAVRRIDRKNPGFFGDIYYTPVCKEFAWVFSPVFLPVYFALPFVKAALWASSLGLISPPWRRGRDA